MSEQKIICPKCGGDAERKAKGSKELGSKRVRVASHCTDKKCGHIFDEVITSKKDKGKY